MLAQDFVKLWIVKPQGLSWLTNFTWHCLFSFHFLLIWGAQYSMDFGSWIQTAAQMLTSYVILNNLVSPAKGEPSHVPVKVFRTAFNQQRVIAIISWPSGSWTQFLFVEERGWILKGEWETWKGERWGLSNQGQKNYRGLLRRNAG